MWIRRAACCWMAATTFGWQCPVATTAMGRAWLSAIGAGEREEFLERVRKRDGTDWAQTRRGIERAIHEHGTLGVTCSFGEWQQDINGIACAIRPGDDLPPMAISCGGSAARLSPQFLLGEVRPRLIAMVARIEDRPVGFFLGCELKPSVFFAWFYGVLPEVRRQGIASQLMEAVHDWARTNDYEANQGNAGTGPDDCPWRLFGEGKCVQL